MAEAPQASLVSLQKRLAQTRRRLLASQLIVALLQLIGVLGLLWGVALLLEALLWLPVSGRTVLFLGLMLGSLALSLWQLGQLLRAFWRLDEEHLARQIGRQFPEVADRLLTLLQLERGRRSPAPRALVERAEQELLAQLGPVPFEQLARLRPSQRMLGLGLGPLVLLGFGFLLAPEAFQAAATRIFSPGRVFERPLPFTLLVTPGDTTLARGDTLRIKATLQGTLLPPQLTLALRYAGELRTETFTLTPNSLGQAQFTLPNLQRPLQYRLEAPPAATPWHAVTLRERPFTRNLQLMLHYPVYTGLPPQTLPPDVGHVTALPGTQVHLQFLTAGAPVTQAVLRFDNGAALPLTLNDSLARGTFVLLQEGTYWIELQTAEGLIHADPIRYQLNLLPDEAPTITLLRPEATYTLDDALQAPLLVRVHDDFGFTGLRLYWRLAQSNFKPTTPDFTYRTLPLTTPRPLDQEIDYLWELRTDSLDLVPGDVLEYYLEVWDNDRVSGPKANRTPIQQLRLPSLAERYETLDAAQDNVAEGLESLREQAEQLRNTFQELQETLRRTQRAGWNEQQQAEQLRQRQEALEEQVDALAQQLEHLAREMQTHQLVSDETLQRYQELQRVVEEIRSPELRQALEQLQEALRALDLPRMLENLEQVSFNEAQFRERIERALELFKRLRTQQQLEEAARRAEALARTEERLAEQTQQLQRQATLQATPNPEALARQQEAASQEAQQLEQLLEETRRQMEGLRGTPRQAMDSLQQGLRRLSLPERMQQNAQQLRQGNFSGAQQEQQQLQQQLDELATRLNQLRQQMEGGQLQLNVAGLRRALRHVLLLSEAQEALRNELGNLRTDRPSNVLTRRQEELIQGTRTVTDSLRQLARRIPQMERAVQQTASEALRAMDASVSGMTEGTTRLASSHQTAAMMHLNELARMLADLLEQLMQQGGGGMSLQQMIQQLQQMAEQQQQLNDQIQQLLNDIQGTRLVTDQLERMRQLARQQEAIRRQLHQLARDREARRRLLGDLDALARQMEETVQELQQGQLDRQTIERQRQILTRLLEAQHSIREQDEEPRRQSRPGEDMVRESPPELRPQQELDRLRRALIEALESGYAPDYEALIRRYFELLERLKQQTPRMP
jgi:hypothetical protein